MVGIFSCHVAVRCVRADRGQNRIYLVISGTTLCALLSPLINATDNATAVAMYGKRSRGLRTPYIIDPLYFLKVVLPMMNSHVLGVLEGQHVACLF